MFRPSCRPLAIILFGLSLWMGLLSVESSATAQESSPQGKISIRLNSGELVEGLLLGKSEVGYRIEVAGAEVTILYTKVKSVSICPADTPKDIDCSQLKQPEERALPPAPAPPAPTPATQQLEVEEAEEDFEGPADRPLISGPVPPKPEARGAALTIFGWISFGLGLSGAGVFGLLHAITSSGNSSTADDFLAVTIGSLGIASAGLTMAIVGMVQRANFNEEMRHWQQNYGVLDTQPSPNLVITPILGKETQGLALSFSF